MDLEALRAAYCPPLDEALFYAIASDFDLQNESHVSELKEALRTLMEGALLEQELELLPQAEDQKPASPESLNDDEHKRSTISQRSTALESVTSLGDTPLDKVSTELAYLHVAEEGGHAADKFSDFGDAGVAFKDATEESKVAWMKRVFPLVSETNIKIVLARSNGEFDKVADELLNVSFLNDGQEHDLGRNAATEKGIEAFLNADGGNVTRKKGRTRHRRNRTQTDQEETWTTDSPASSGVATPTSNAWTGLSEDVKFIALRTSLKPTEITSVYHANGAKLSPSIRALIIMAGEAYRRDSPLCVGLVKSQLEELQIDFPAVPLNQLYGALVITNKIPTAARELLEAMTRPVEAAVVLGKVAGLASYAPIKISEDVNVKKPVTWNAVQPSNDPYTISHFSNAHGEAAAEAFDKAHSAYRRGKSDHLMGGAAAYYAQIGHDKLKAAKASQAAAADAHVRAQSSGNMLDLHGVNVPDAVRICKAATEAWWEGLGERKLLVGGVGYGFRVITGVGRHSTDGRGRLGPAVSKMLLREGWKVRVESGEVVVSGRVRSGG